MQPLAFQRQEGHLVGRVLEAQLDGEVERIDDGQRLAQPHMLRPQVAVPLHHPAGRDPCFEHLGMPCQEGPLPLAKRVQTPRRQVPLRQGQVALVLVVTDSVPPDRLPDGPARGKLTVLSTGALFAEAIRRLHGGGSIAELLGVE